MELLRVKKITYKRGTNMLLVTGITGRSGEYFVKELINNNYKGIIRCIVRKNSDTSQIDASGLNIKKVVGDLNDQEFMNEVLKDIETVLHIGSITYSIPVVKAAVLNNVQRVILVHTTGIYSKYKSASEEYKSIELTIDKIIKDSNSQVGLVYLRPTMIFGSLNDMNMIIFIKMVDKLRLFPVVAKGKNLLQPVNRRDLGNAYFQILVKSEILYGDYILSGERPLSTIEIFKLISDGLNKKTNFISFPLGPCVICARLIKLSTLGKIDYVEKVQRMGEDRNFPHELAYNDFGYQPMPFEEGLNIEIQEYLIKRMSKNK
jgi:nucleoside-diphosphate-sugar epimerase